MKNIKWASIIIALCYIVAGILFFIDPNVTREILCSWLGYAAIIIGILDVLFFLLRSKQQSFFRNDFMVGLILITIGIVALARRYLFIELVYLVLAITIMISGYRKLQDGVVAYRLGSNHGLLYFLLALISIAIGVVMIVDPSIPVVTLHYLIGVGLMFSGISDLISSVFLSKKMIRYVKQKDQYDNVKVKETENNKEEKSDDYYDKFIPDPNAKINLTLDSPLKNNDENKENADSNANQ